MGWRLLKWLWAEEPTPPVPPRTVACECSRYPGEASRNVVKGAAEVLTVSVSWCPALGSTGVIISSAWVVTPATGTTPLLAPVGSWVVGEISTSAQLSAGDGGTLYQVMNVVTLTRATDATPETMTYTFWVWVPAAWTPAPCSSPVVA